MKNWEPLVLGPALAMDRVKGRSCRRLLQAAAGGGRAGSGKVWWGGGDVGLLLQAGRAAGAGAGKMRACAPHKQGDTQGRRGPCCSTLAAAGRLPRAPERSAAAAQLRLQRSAPMCCGLQAAARRHRSLTVRFRLQTRRPISTRRPYHCLHGGTLP
jgi:hypothetical protein